MSSFQECPHRERFHCIHTRRVLCTDKLIYMFVNNLQTMWKECSTHTGDEAGVHVVCVCTVNILVSCEVSGGVVVRTLFKAN